LTKILTEFFSSRAPSQLNMITRKGANVTKFLKSIFPKNLLNFKPLHRP